MREKTYQAERRRLTVARLRQKLQKFELIPAVGDAVFSGFDAIDACLPPHHGLLRGAMHEICAAKTGDFASAVGFGAHLGARFADGKAVLSGQTRQCVSEHGQPYALALPTVGLDRHQLIHIDGADLTDLLWAAEEALSCPAVGCVVLMSLERAPDFTDSRRLSMACRASNRPLVLVLGAEAGQASTAATTRWQISAAPHNGWQVYLQRLRGSFAQTPPTAGWQVFPWREQLPLSDGEAASENVQLHTTTAYGN
ncbi:MAG: Uncharacterised protein [Rhodobiaceae bacterium UBA7378]|mgnify:CR=1 FL=1|nr:MAG: Uncharacterised protein [Rhodobiaceae bacterium UBA7378]|tara:strand:- start:652 stop:1413 length:762 start_codon:yes stop_codon:yes gene_type:complete